MSSLCFYVLLENSTAALPLLIVRYVLCYRSSLLELTTATVSIPRKLWLFMERNQWGVQASLLTCSVAVTGRNPVSVHPSARPLVYLLHDCISTIKRTGTCFVVCRAFPRNKFTSSHIGSIKLHSCEGEFLY